MACKGYNVWAPNWELGDAKKVRQAGLDTIRVQFLPESEWYQNQLDAFHNIVLPDCHASGLKIILNIWRRDMRYTMIESEWLKLIRKYNHRACIVAYDLVNEPTGDSPCRYIYPMVGRLRKHTDKTFIIEPGPGPDCKGFAGLIPANDDNCIYSFHFYEPYPFTMQGIEGRESPATWPGKHYGFNLDDDWLIKRCRPAIAFSWKYNEKILIAETGVSKHAPEEDAERWLRAVDAMCSKLGWDYLVHGCGSDDYPPRTDFIERLVGGT